MPSEALTSLLDGLDEVRDLQRANPTPLGGMPSRPKVVRAINRSSVVLLTSHLERYLRALNEETVERINSLDVAGAQLPQAIRLHHSRAIIDRMLETQWDNRSAQLEEFALSDSWLWSDAPKGLLAAERLLKWMKSPSPKRILQLYRMWDVEDVFSRVTRKKHTRDRLWLRLDELVTKRNNIAHGDVTTEATSQDVASYMAVVREFCARGDRVMSRTVARHFGTALPW